MLLLVTCNCNAQLEKSSQTAQAVSSVLQYIQQAIELQRSAGFHQEVGEENTLSRPLVRLLFCISTWKVVLHFA